MMTFTAVAHADIPQRSGLRIASALKLLPTHPGYNISRMQFTLNDVSHSLIRHHRSTCSYFVSAVIIIITIIIIICICLEIYATTNG